MDDLVEVPERQFYDALYADPRDIMPTIITATYPYVSEWRARTYDRALFGRSHDGKYWLARIDALPNESEAER